MIMNSSEAEYEGIESDSFESSVCTCMLSESTLAQHYLDGHRPSLPKKCPWCAQAGMRHRKAVRVAHSDRVN
jgi:hypothetical protein